MNTVNITSQPQLLVTQSDKRVGLILLAPAVSAVYATNKPATNQTGHAMSSSSNPLQLYAERDGDVVKQSWWVWSTAIPIPISFVEVFE
jgi:hypothetical protein